jgi:hypothetical protein
MAKECSKQPGVFALKPFWTCEMKWFETMNLSSRLATMLKKILPTELVSAIGRNSAGSEVLDDFASNWMDAAAQAGGMS